MQTFKTNGARALLLGGAVALALAGCGDKDEAAKAVAAGDVDVAMMKAGDMDAYFDVDARSVTTAQGEAGLAAMGLLDKSDGVTWASRSGDNGNYAFDELVFTGDDGETVTIDSLELMGLRDMGGELALDKLVAEDTVISPPDAEGELRIDRVRLIEPDMDDVAAFLNGDSGVDMPSARAFSVSGVAGDLDDETTSGTMSVKTVAFAKPRSGTSNDGFFMVDDVEMDIVDSEDGTPVTIRIRMDDAMVSGIRDAALLDGDFEALMSSPMIPSPEEIPYRNMLVEDVSVTADTLSFDIDTIKIASDIDGDMITSTTVMEPIRFGFTGAPTHSEFADLYDMMQQVGLEEIVMTAGGTSVVDFGADRAYTDDSYFDFKDLLRVEMEYDMGGVAAMRDAQAEARAALGDMPDPEDDYDAFIEYQMAAGNVGMAGLDQLTVDDFRMVLDDNSIMDKVFEQVAVQQGTTAKALKMQAKGMLAMGTMMASGSGVDPEIVSETIEAVGEFIDNPGSKLVIAVDPASPTSVMAFQELDKAGMGFSATVEK